MKLTDNNTIRICLYLAQYEPQPDAKSYAKAAYNDAHNRLTALGIAVPTYSRCKPDISFAIRANVWFGIPKLTANQVVAVKLIYPEMDLTVEHPDGIIVEYTHYSADVTISRRRPRGPRQHLATVRNGRIGRTPVGKTQWAGYV